MPEDKIDQKVNISGKAGDVTVIGKLVQAADAKVFRKLGLEQRLGFSLVVLLILGSSYFLWINLRRETPQFIPGDFRIAVAGFSVKGRPEQADLGLEMAAGVHLHLEENLQGFDIQGIVTVWGPDQVGVIQAGDAGQRAIKAQELAEKLRADIVVYGEIDTTQPVWRVTPEFYISAENLHEAEEIAGQHALGSTFPLSGRSNFSGRVEIGTQMSSRTRVLAAITAGLYLYSDRLYLPAFDAFQLAENMEGWEDEQDKRVVYLLAGNAAAQGNELELAETYYNRALELDSEYSRGYIGLASVAYSLALEPYRQTNNPTDTDLDLIEQAISYNVRALRSANQPELADVNVKVHFNLGQCFFAEAYAKSFMGDEADYGRAVDEWRQVIQAYGKGANPRIRELAAEAHGRIALVYSLMDNHQQASKEYEKAAGLLEDNPERQELFIGRAEQMKQLSSQ